MLKVITSGAWIKKHCKPQFHKRSLSHWAPDMLQWPKSEVKWSRATGMVLWSWFSCRMVHLRQHGFHSHVVVPHSVPPCLHPMLVQKPQDLKCLWNLLALGQLLPHLHRSVRARRRRVVVSGPSFGLSRCLVAPGLCCFSWMILPFIQVGFKQVLCRTTRGVPDAGKST